MTPLLRVPRLCLLRPLPFEVLTGRTVRRLHARAVTVQPFHRHTSVRYGMGRPGTPLREALRVTAGNNPASRWLSCGQEGSGCSDSGESAGAFWPLSATHEREIYYGALDGQCDLKGPMSSRLLVGSITIFATIHPHPVCGGVLPMLVLLVT